LRCSSDTLVFLHRLMVLQRAFSVGGNHIHFRRRFRHVMHPARDLRGRTLAGLFATSAAMASPEPSMAYLCIQTFASCCCRPRKCLLQQVTILGKRSHRVLLRNCALTPLCGEAEAQLRKKACASLICINKEQGRFSNHQEAEYGYVFL
jgi:hypothetical protein